MEKRLMARFEAVVARLEAAIVNTSISFSERVFERDFVLEATDPTIDGLFTRPLHRVVVAAENFGREVLEAVKILEKAFGKKEAKQNQIKVLPVQRWRRVGETEGVADQLDYRSLIKQKIQSLKASSSGSSPICFRCENVGHLARHCQNKMVCFVCNRLGHGAAQCRSMTKLRFGTGNTNSVGAEMKKVNEVNTSNNTNRPQHSIRTGMDEMLTDKGEENTFDEQEQIAESTTNVLSIKLFPPLTPASKSDTSQLDDQATRAPFSPKSVVRPGSVEAIFHQIEKDSVVYVISPIQTNTDLNSPINSHNKFSILQHEGSDSDEECEHIIMESFEQPKVDNFSKSTQSGVSSPEQVPAELSASGTILSSPQLEQQQTQEVENGVVVPQVIAKSNTRQNLSEESKGAAKVDSKTVSNHLSGKISRETMHGVDQEIVDVKMNNSILSGGKKRPRRSIRMQMKIAGHYVRVQ